jgi:Putative adhesin
MNPCHAVLRCIRHVLLALAVLCGCGRSAGGAPPKAPASASPAAAPGSSPQGMHWSGKLAPGRVLDIREVSGKIHVTAASGDVGQVDATATGNAGAHIPLRIEEDERGVTIRYEDHDGRGGGCDCDDHDNHPPVAIDIVAKAPPGVRVVVRTVEGDIDVDGVTGPVEARAVDGAVDLRSVTTGRASTVNGAIRASFTGAGPTDDSELATVNGTVDVTLAASASAEVAARSVNGTVSVDFPVTGSLERHRAHGSIGHGGHELRLRSVNGAIHVARAS